MLTHIPKKPLKDTSTRVEPAAGAVATHLETCADCALVVAEFQQVVREASALGPLTPPPHVWSQLQARLESSQSKVQRPESTVARRFTRFTWAMATAALIVVAFFTGRFVNQREQQTALQQQTAATAVRASADNTVVRERVLLIAVGDHLERSQMVLVELSHAETSGELDISAERQLADDLLASNRLYRQTAQQMGQANVAGVLDELETRAGGTRARTLRQCRCSSWPTFSSASNRRASCSR